MANANYTNPQFQSDVAMDPDGNFVVVWANQGQDESYFNDISMQCYDDDGNPLGNAIIVDQEPANPAINYNSDTNFNPSVAIQFDNVNSTIPVTDNIVVSWTTAIELPNQVITNPNGTVYVRGFSFDPQQKQGPATLPWNQFAVSALGGNSSVSMDGQCNFVVAWQQPGDANVSNQTSEGIYSAEYQLEDYTSGAALKAPVNMRPTFRVNSSSTNTASQTIWPFNQESADVQMDIDGDIVTSYQGYAPQVADDISIPSSFFTSQFALQKETLTFAFPGGVANIGATDTISLSLNGNATGNFVFKPTATTTASQIATIIQNELNSLPGLAGNGAVAVTGTLSGNTYRFIVTFGIDPEEPNIALAASNFTAAAGFVAATGFTSTTTTQWNNADLLTWFDPLAGASTTPIVGAGSLSAGAVIYSNFLTWAGSILGNPAAEDNFTVQNAIDKVLFDAEENGASADQLGRLQAILNDVAGLLNGESDGVLTSQWDTNSTDSQNSTYSDNIVSSQRSGENARAYIVVPDDVQQGTFQLSLTVGPVVESPVDVVPPAGTTLTTGLITMPTSAPGGEPGGPIAPVTTMENISNAIDAVLGTLGAAVGQGWQGSVNVREVYGVTNPSEVSARAGSDFAVPVAVPKAEAPTVRVTQTNASGIKTRLPAVYPHSLANAFIFELVFEGQAADIPIAVASGPTPPNDQQWIETKTVTTTTNGKKTTTPSYAEGVASTIKVFAGDYAGLQGSPQYNASIAMTSAGSMVTAYTDEPLLSDEVENLADAYGNPITNVYYRQLAESTDTAGPRVVTLTDGNGVDLLNAPKASATGVDAKYLVLTFDEPMLADNPATDPDSVYNPANYQIYDNSGNLLSNVITHVDYGLSEVSQVANAYGFDNINSSSDIPDNKWEVVLTLDDPANNGPLPDGTYTIKVLAAEHSATGGQTGLCNVYGTPLNLTGYDQPNSIGFQDTVTISASTNPGSSPIAPGLSQTDTAINSVPYRGGYQLDPSVGTTNDLSQTVLNGNYVVVWTSDINGTTNIIGQLYKSSGIARCAEFVVNTTASGSWGSPAVGMDAAGNFVVVWCGAGPNATVTDPSDIYARSYNAQGDALTSQYLVDQYVGGVQEPGVQDQPAVSMSPDGTFVISWTSTPIYYNLSNVSSANSAIFARVYNDVDVPQANEMQITPTFGHRRHSLGRGDGRQRQLRGRLGRRYPEQFELGAYGDYFTAHGGTAGSSTLPTSWTSTGPMLLNQTPNARGTFGEETPTDLHDTGPRVAMDPSAFGASPAGFVVSWADLTSVANGYDVYAQQFNANGAANSSGPLGTAAQVMVNQTTANWQLMPAVSVDSSGDIMVDWTTYGQDNADNGYPGVLDYGIYGRIYYTTGSNTGEFRINATTLGDQVAPAVAGDNFENDFLVAWVGPDTTAGGTAIFDRDIDPPTVATPNRVVNSNTAPVISTNPSSQTLGVGQTASFRAVATGKPAPSVQWQVSTNGGGSYANISGATSTTYTFTTIAAESGYEYEAVFTNSAGITTSKAATLTVDTVPVVTTNPSGATVNAGLSATFTAAATGTPAPSVQWQVSTNGGTSYTAVPGATSATYNFVTAVAQSGSLYRAVFSNGIGTATTTAATLVVHALPVVTVSPNSLAVNAGQSVSFTAAATGSPTPTVQWQLSTNGGGTFSAIAAQPRRPTRLPRPLLSRATSTKLCFPILAVRPLPRPPS